MWYIIFILIKSFSKPCDWKRGHPGRHHSYQNRNVSWQSKRGSVRRTLYWFVTSLLFKVTSTTMKAKCLLLVFRSICHPWSKPVWVHFLGTRFIYPDYSLQSIIWDVRTRSSSKLNRLSVFCTGKESYFAVLMDEPYVSIFFLSRTNLCFSANIVGANIDSGSIGLMEYIPDSKWEA